MIRMVNDNKTKDALTKKNKPVESLKRKRTELATTGIRKQKEKKSMKTKER